MSEVERGETERRGDVIRRKERGGRERGNKGGKYREKKKRKEGNITKFLNTKGISTF